MPPLCEPQRCATVVQDESGDRPPDDGAETRREVKSGYETRREAKDEKRREGRTEERR
eukprot:COSAG06_NODE_47698_length_337_cov_1.000000_1_plen_57_part_10